MKRFYLICLVIFLLLSISGCSFPAGLGNHTKKEWSIDARGLKALIEDTTQGMSEGDRLLQSIDRVEFPKGDQLKVYGQCQPAGGSEEPGEFGIAFITQDSRVRMEISVDNTCGIQREDPRIAVMNDKLSNALGEKIAADCGKVLVDWIQMSANRLIVKYVKSL